MEVGTDFFVGSWHVVSQIPTQVLELRLILRKIAFNNTDQFLDLARFTALATLLGFGEERLEQLEEPTLHNDELPFFLDLKFPDKLYGFVDESAVVYEFDYLLLVQLTCEQVLGLGLAAFEFRHGAQLRVQLGGEALFVHAQNGEWPFLPELLLQTRG